MGTSSDYNRVKGNTKLAAILQIRASPHSQHWEIELLFLCRILIELSSLSRSRVQTILASSPDTLNQSIVTSSVPSRVIKIHFRVNETFMARTSLACSRGRQLMGRARLLQLRSEGGRAAAHRSFCCCQAIVRTAEVAQGME